MTNPGSIPLGARVAGSQGELLGVVHSLFVDDASGVPAWAAVQGQPGTVAAIVPLQVGRFDGAVLHLPYSAPLLASAPSHDPHLPLTAIAGEALARHYGLRPAAPESPAATDRPDPGPEPGMVRSEEKLRTSTVRVAVGRARLVTYIVTEEQTFTVPVRRQEVRLVHEALPEHEQVISDEPATEATYEVVLHAEQVHFTTSVVPVERVRLVRHVVTGEQRITGTVRSEQIDVEPIDAGHQP